jgi:hypothetical protein
MVDARSATRGLKLFVSYSRRDLAACGALVLELEAQGFEF